MKAYAEIAVTTNYSFLRGASHPWEFSGMAAKLRLAAIGIADRNTLAGIVRAYAALQGVKENRPKLLVGARLVFVDGTPDILAYPTDRAAYGRLCRLLSAGKLRAPKGECHLALGDLLKWQEGLLLVVMAPRPDQKERVDDSPKNFWNKNLAHEDAEVGELPDEIYASSPQISSGEIQSLLESLLRVAPGRLWLGVSMPHKGDDRRRLREWQRVAHAAGVPLLATNDVLYHSAERRELQDVVTCIREHVTLNEAGRLLEINAERYLKAPDDTSGARHALPFAQAAAVIALMRH